MKFSHRIQQVKPSMTLAIDATAKDLKAQGEDVIGFGAGEPDFNTPANIASAGRQALTDGFTSYNPSPGYNDLREVIASEVSKTRNISVDSGNVVVTPGGKPIMFFVMMALIE